jgi:hypothetical protein
MTSCRKCFWNSCFKVEDSGKNHWNKSRHRRGNCEMRIFTAQYCHRLWGLLLSHSRWSQHDFLSLPPTRAARKQRTINLGRCYQPERPFCTLTRYTLRHWTVPFTYACLSAQVSGRETRVHAGRWHAGHILRQHGCWNRRSWVLGNLIYEGFKLQSCGRSVCTRPHTIRRSQRINIASLPF